MKFKAKTRTLEMMDVATGAVTTYEYNEDLDIGQHFRLTGRTTEFVCVGFWFHPLKQTRMVRGISICGKMGTGAEVTQTLKPQPIQG